MDSSRKRKIPPTAPSSSNDGGASKKLKLLNSNHAPTQSRVQLVGQAIVDQLHRAQDKTGRPIATLFITLPSREELPDYYEVTKLPVAIDTIQEKIKRNAYPTITAVESDLKRMVQNAKDYNAPKSDIYEDAERIRKLVYNYMKQHNPAYDDENYVSFATPLPVAGQNGFASEISFDSATESREIGERPKRAIPVKPETPARLASASVPLSATTGEGTGDGDFTGKTFQQAQEMIMIDLVRHTDDDGLAIFTPFLTLPPRSLTDYYQFIKYPVSLKSVQKRSRGQHGRNPPTGISDFKTWDAFEEEVSFVWRNAKDYNEDGSEMYMLASELEKQFRIRLAEAKEKVDEPAQPRLKLTTKPKVMLNLSQNRGSPATTPGVSIDHDALARQKHMIQAGANGRQIEQSQRPAMANGVRSSSQAPMPNGFKPQSSSAGSPPLVAGAVKSNTPVGPWNSLAVPAPVASLTLQAGTSMPPPPVRPPSGSPFPGVPTAPIHHYIPPPLPIMQPTNLRQHPVSDALLPNLTIATHPNLKLQKPFSMSIPPHSTLAHQSHTVTLLPSHYFLQISPEVSKALAHGRPYKIFVTVNGTRQVQKETEMTDGGRRKHVYDGLLAQGVNRIEVEVVSTGDGKSGLETEKVTVFASLMR